MEKMSVKAQAETRANLYQVTSEALRAAGKNIEPFKGGVLIDLGEGYWGKMNIAVCDASKFDVQVARAEYQDKLTKDAEKAQKRAEKLAKDAEKAAAKAEKAEKATKAE
jgi:hypothetical protein